MTEPIFSYKLRWKIQRIIDILRSKLQDYQCQKVIHNTIIVKAAVRKRHEAKDMKDKGEKRESKLVFIDVYYVSGTDLALTAGRISLTSCSVQIILE